MSCFKILHISTGLGQESASYRLHLALRQEGVLSYVGVQQSTLNDPHILRISSPLDTFLAKCNNKFLRLFRPNPQTFFTSYILPNGIATKIKKIAPDIIHLHWISNFISPWTLHQIAKLNIPVTWTLHDTWAFTGGCHYGKCTKWLSNCTQCPMLKTFSGFDIPHAQWKAKHSAYANLQPHIVTPSLEMKQKTRQSSLLKKLSITHTPNTLDTEIFYPINKQNARQELNLDTQVKYILFGAMSATSNYNKGYDLLQMALQYIPNASNTHCLIFGASEGESLSLPATFLGRLNDPKTIALAYAAADVFVCPSREESFSQTTLESLACGTPVVGFGIGGIPDMITHQKNGYIAPPYDTKDLANGITYVLEDEARRERMCKAARETVEERYSYPIVAKQYIQLYEDILAKHKR